MKANLREILFGGLAKPGALTSIDSIDYLLLTGSRLGLWSQETDKKTWVKVLNLRKEHLVD